MGSAASGMPDDKEQRIRSQLIDAELQRDRRLSAKIIKLLLLGASDCGKSTVIKQMRILHGQGFSDDEHAQQKGIIYSNIIQSMKAILAAMLKFGIKFAEKSNEANATVILQLDDAHADTRPLTAEAVHAIKRLWQDSGVLECFARSSEYELSDSTKYFLDDIDRIAQTDFNPSDQDILRARVKTTGVIEVRFALKTFEFRVFDVGGQRSERKKWIHCFDNVNAVMFITSLSEFDQKLSEDTETNRMHESLILFKAICNNRYFAKASMLLFLNKKDLFEEKIRKTPITVAFPDYQGPQEYHACAGYIQEKFNALNLTKKLMYTHHTCATDTKQIEFVLEASIDTIISSNLKTSGI